jgi:hypothetical protein
MNAAFFNLPRAYPFARLDPGWGWLQHRKISRDLASERDASLLIDFVLSLE